MVVIFIFLIAFLLRLINLNQSLWLDEAVQAVTAKGSILGIFQEIKGDFHPPLYHFLMHFWIRLFGVSEVSLRLPSVLAGVGAVFFVYLLGREIFKKEQPALITALFLATAPFHIYYSQEARMYSMVTFLTAGSFYYFLRILENKTEKKNWRDKGLYFLFTLLALYTDYYAFLILMAQILILLWKRNYKLLIFNSLFLIFYLPWLPMFFTQLKTGMAATRVLPGWGRLVNLPFAKALPLTLVKFTLGRITIFDKRLYLGVILGILGGLGVLGAQIIMKIRETKEDWGRVVGLWLFLPLLTAWMISLLIPNYQPFRLLLVLPAFYLLLVWEIASFKKRQFQVLAIGAVLGVNLISLSVYYLNPYFQREDWRGVVNFLKKQEGVVILPSQTSAWPLWYYDSQIRLITSGEGIEPISEAKAIPAEDTRVFYIRYLVPLFDPEELILAGLKQKDYTKVEEKSFNQIPVWEFEKR